MKDGKIIQICSAFLPINKTTIDNCGYFNIGNIIKCETFPSKYRSKNTGVRSKSNKVEFHSNTGPKV